MGHRGFWIFLIFTGIVSTGCKERNGDPDKQEETLNTPYDYKEAYRPQFHFSPPEKWMNDPNGLVFHQGTYHLFYQYYPEDMVWGPMHWGHAVSKDLVFWENKPIALYPDELGWIFSGGAVLDKNNSSGFGEENNPPLVASFTYHDPEGDKRGRNDFQTQGIAYSLDNGESWTKYEGNPVIPNEGIRDFRDPKIFWHEDSGSWILVLVAGDRALFYKSDNLKNWTRISEFGKDQGAHGGVWECPDLFELEVEGSDEKKWVLLISINPGAPNGGNGTQYFVGDFDGTTFVSDQKEHKWIDWGRDNYAGITYDNSPGGERIFMGWMSNWDYARNTPTEIWRGAMTLPRILSLRKRNSTYELVNYPVPGFNTLLNPEFKENLVVNGKRTHLFTFDHFNESEVRFRTAHRDFTIYFTNLSGDSLLLSMDRKNKEFRLDRSRSGKVDFHEKFALPVQRMPTPHLPEDPFEVRLILDWSSIEIFINEGQYSMTARIFPEEFYTELHLENPNESDLIFLDFQVSSVESIWRHQLKPEAK